MGPVFRAGPLHYAGYRRCWLHEYQHQAHGCARAEVDGRGEVYARYVWCFHADVRYARHRSQRTIADRESEKHANILLPQLSSATRTRLHYAGPLDKDSEQPV